MCFVRSGTIVGLVFLIVALSPPPVSAQSDSRSDRSRPVQSAVRDRLVDADSLLDFRTRRQGRVRVDQSEGVVRAEYRIARTREAPRHRGAEEAALAFLREEASRYGLNPDLGDLIVARLYESPHHSSVTLQQTLNGVPVLRREIKVNLDRNRRPTLVISGYAPHLRDYDGFDERPSVPVAAAQDAARSALVSSAATSEATLFVLAEERPRLVYRVIAWPDVGGEWEVLVDAKTAEIVWLRDQAVHHGTGTQAPLNFGNQHGGSTRVDGSGLVFDPDPVSSAGTTYGGVFIDDDDADSPALNEQRREVPLREITQGTDGLFRLEGPNVRIVGTGVGSANYNPPAEADPHAFRYTRSDNRFEAVMAYYHADTSQRYANSLNAGIPTAQTVNINPQGFVGNDQSADNSSYYPFLHSIAFGTGGIDDAEDASVIRHEHAHAILNTSAPGLLSTQEGAAFHEGWADYWATSMLRGQIENGSIPDRDWTHIFPWDGNNSAINWCGRFLNHPGHYPDAMQLAPPSGCGAYPTIYAHGLLWATTLMEIYDELGRAVTDRLNLASHTYLSTPVTFVDAAEALLQADADLYNGAHTTVLANALGARGFLDVDEYGPVISHSPLSHREELGGTEAIFVSATGIMAPVDAVIVHYGSEPNPSETLELTLVGDRQYGGELPMPDQPDTVRYYIEAVDQQGRRSFLPADGSHFVVIVGPDEAGPSLAHTPITRSSMAAWPPVILVIAEDVIGIDSVWVEYSIGDETGASVTSGSFGLELHDGAYQGPIPVPAEMIAPGYGVAYRILARDRSQASNVSQLPATDFYRFAVIIEGVLAEYDFEVADPGIVASGVWQRGEPGYGLHTARSGGSVWGTLLDAPYPSHAQRSTLDLPPLNLSAAGEAYLVFWHWYDLEHNGAAVPDSMKSIPLWDGGNVKVSIDGGASWSVASPMGDYNGTVHQPLDNPLGGEPAFGGYSFGWRRAVVPLPAASSVMVRFDFGTDVSNEDISLAYAGWFIDDVSILTSVPQDVEAPQAFTPLANPIIRAPGQAPPRPIVRATDDTGIAIAEVIYQTHPNLGVPVEGRFRLAMTDTSIFYFTGSFPALSGLAAGDRVTFRYRVRDFDGRETYLPRRAEPPLEVLFRTLDRSDVLHAARPTGGWEAADDGWRLEAEDGDAYSALVLNRVDLASNADVLQLEIRHRYKLAAGLAANVKITRDGGLTWDVLHPDEGYGAVSDLPSAHTMEGQATFRGDHSAEHVSRFDLRAFAGQQIQIRLDFGSDRPLNLDEGWEVLGVAVLSGTVASAFERSSELALHPNFPDPFFGQTSVSFSLPETEDVRLEVYDALGRRRDVLVDGRRPSGTHTLTYDGSHLASGVYILRLQAGRSQRTERMVVVR